MLSEQLLRIKTESNLKTKVINYVPDFDHAEIHIIKYKDKFCNGYIVQSEKLKRNIKNLGLKVILGRYYVLKSFTEYSEKFTIKEMDNTKNNIVVTGGVLWTSKLFPRIMRLINKEIITDSNIIFITGKDEKFYNKIKSLKEIGNNNIIPLPFLRPNELFQIYLKADIVILTSIAPATLFELIKSNAFPILLSRTNPGQEYFNKTYAVKNELVLLIKSYRNLEKTLKRLIISSEELNIAKTKNIQSYEKELKYVDEFRANINDFFKSL